MNEEFQEDEQGFIIPPPMSVIHLEYEILKKDSNRVYMVAGKKGDPFLEVEVRLKEFLEGNYVRCIGFKIVD